ncbi:MAG: beta-lactamase family protein [Robiginitomaculum sp.]|nr:beta-lactamase family protein [Robiginitomaculum sp.]
MSKWSRISLIFLALVFVVGCTSLAQNKTSVHRLPSNSEINIEIDRLMLREDVKGMAIAVIEGETILHVDAYGMRNVEQALPLKTDTIMYGASLTKAAFAYMVLQLVDEGKIDLDATIDTYLPKPLPEYERWRSLDDNEEWKQLTARSILTHTTGLNNLRYLEENQNLTFHFTPGESYAYSGEGIKILQTVLEEGLGLDVKAEMKKRLFDPFGMPNTSMQWREDFAQNMADGYDMDGRFEPHDERSNVSASGSMDTTIADQAQMWRGMLNGDGLSKKGRQEWVRAQAPIRSAQKFPTILFHETADVRGEAIDLSAALGVESWRGLNGRNFAKGGHNNWTGNIVMGIIISAFDP